MELGWVMMIVVGGVAGYIASRITNTQRGLVANIVLGIIGAVLLNLVLSKGFGIHLGGLVGQFFTAVAGASLLIVIRRAIRKG
ncbi:GlsB/YeaQ/YmgE family stress response membrane protein [Shimia sp. SDUM112013]|uniref:GlsB/YeaQ/YmgE family stress response membrane protein n=1 Tax=Shimia sp. SDUM112013 TaxID=3136160 RepID=UPI0032F01A32